MAAFSYGPPRETLHLCGVRDEGDHGHSGAPVPALAGCVCVCVCAAFVCSPEALVLGGILEDHVVEYRHRFRPEWPRFNDI